MVLVVLPSRKTLLATRSPMTLNSQEDDPFKGYQPNLFPRTKRAIDIVQGWVSSYILPTEADVALSEHYTHPLDEPVRPVTGWPPATPWTETDGVVLPINQMVDTSDLPPEAA